MKEKRKMAGREKMTGKRKMSHQEIPFGMVLGILLAVLGFLCALQPKPAEAACGASTSSCKTCHEVKGEDPVSKKGDWHTQHAFGDFCQACHLGVATANDKTQAHVGIVAKPLAQSSETCASCHPSDTAARVAKYGGTVAGGSGSSGGSGGSGSASSGAASSANSQGAGSVAVSAAATQIPPSDNPNFDLIDFNKSIQKKVPVLAWILGILNGLVLIVLLGLIWRWKKGVWPWVYLKREGHWVNLSTFPVEGQTLIHRLLKSNLQTVLAINELFEHAKGNETLLAAVVKDTTERIKLAREDETKGIVMKEGKDHVL